MAAMASSLGTGALAPPPRSPVGFSADIERVTLPDSSILAHYLTTKMCDVVEGMRVFPERMLENLEATRGVIYSQSLMLALAATGLTREEAYAAVQGPAMQSWKEDREFMEVVLADPSITSRLERSAIEKAFDLQHQLRHVDAIFARVFAPDRE